MTIDRSGGFDLGLGCRAFARMLGVGAWMVSMRIHRSARYRRPVIFSNVPQHRTSLARLREWRALKGVKNGAAAQGLEDHQRMMQALCAAVSEANVERAGQRLGVR